MRPLNAVGLAGTIQDKVPTDMGIQYRDYMRDEDQGGFGLRGFSSRDIVKTLIIVNAVIFVLQAALTRPYTEGEITRLVNRLVQQPQIAEHLTKLGPGEVKEVKDDLRGQLRQSRVSYLESWFQLEPELVLWGQIWRLTTYDFLHDTQSIFHILFNMLLLWFVGKRVEQYYGPTEFLCFYLMAGVVSGLFFLLWGLVLKDLSPAIGASGAVAAVMVVYAMHWPMDEFRIWGILPVPAYLLAILAAVIDLHPMLLQLGQHHVSDSVAHSAHIGGMLFGVFYVRQGWRLTGWLSRVVSSRLLKRRPKIRLLKTESEEFPHRQQVSVLPSAKEDVSARVDELLAKINEQGSASLTQEEQEFLASASRLYRKPGS